MNSKLLYTIGGITAIAVIAGILGAVASTNIQTESAPSSQTQSVGIGAYVTIEVFNEMIKTPTENIKMVDITRVFREKNIVGVFQTIAAFVFSMLLLTNTTNRTDEMHWSFPFIGGCVMLLITYISLFHNRGKRCYVVTKQKPNYKFKPFNVKFATVKEANAFVRAVSNVHEPVEDQYNPVRVKK